jgi:L-malate glycosyltransferase
LKKKYPCQLRLIMVSRMVSAKQHQPVFEVLKQFADEGLSIKMMVMDDGPLRKELEEFVHKNKLEESISFVGFQKDFINYMAAADLLIHPSLTEASNNVTKEMALLEKTVAVCKDVGDFNDYICDHQNGYLMSRASIKSEIEKVIRNAYASPEKIQEMGKSLKQEVLKRFSDFPENKKRFVDLAE